MNINRILIIGPAWVGDMVMVQSLFMTLKHQNPNNIIDVVAPAWSAPVLARMPEVNKMITVNLEHGKLQLRERYRVGKSLRNKYDKAFILPRTYKSALIPYFARIPKRIGYRGEMRYGLINDVRELDMHRSYKAVEKYLQLAANSSQKTYSLELPHPCLRIDLAKRRQAAQKLHIDVSMASVALMPGAEFGPSKQWPGKYYAELARRFKQQGLNVYVYGSPKDYKIGEEIAQISQGAAVNFCGQTSLEEVIDLLSLPRVAITNDSGLMHIAAAVGRPIVALYGSITPEYTPPLTQQAAIHYLSLDCSPCWKKQCPYGHYNCLHGIKVDDVYQSASKFL